MRTSDPVLKASRAVRLGGCIWLLTLGYFAAQVWVAAAWDPPYELADHTISDLGVTSCDRDAPSPDAAAGPVCSPRHLAMNLTFIAAGLITAAGALLTRSAWPNASRSDRRLVAAGVAALVAAGLGGILVGVAPSNSHPVLHSIGVAPQVPAAAAPLLLGLTLRQARPSLARPWLAWYSIALGALGSVAIVLFLTDHLLGLGTGTMERLGIETHLVWTTTLGAILVRSGLVRSGSA